MPPSATRPSRVVAIVPVRGLELAKSRLGEVLDAEERRDLVEAMLRSVVRSATAAAGMDEVIVVTPDPAAGETARADGAHVLLQAGVGLNEGLEQARREAVARGASAIIVLPADLPDVTASAIEAIVAEAARAPVVALVPDLAGEGTNALLLAPPGLIAFRFGPGSRRAHAEAAAAAGVRYAELAGPLELDLDTADDLLREEAAHSTAAVARGRDEAS
jgi:2-phospho-L-lactate guanylyltransferase